MNNKQHDLSQSTECLSSTGGQIFQIGYVVRRISKGLTDQALPAQFYDVKELLRLPPSS